MSSYSSSKARLYTITFAVAAITATGAWYGAGLKTQRELHQERSAVAQQPISEKIALLEASRAKFQKQRAELQKKIDSLSASAPATAPASSQTSMRTPATDEAGQTGRG